MIQSQQVVDGPVTVINCVEGFRKVNKGSYADLLAIDNVVEDLHGGCHTPIPMSQFKSPKRRNSEEIYGTKSSLKVVRAEAGADSVSDSNSERETN